MSDPTDSSPTADYDSPWKEIIEDFFPDFMAFFFPEAHTAIDWSQPPEFLDKDLQKITADAAIGRRTVDKLAKVWLKDGGEVWVLVHIEVQSGYEAEFAERIYTYNYRSYDRYQRRVDDLVPMAAKLGLELLVAALRPRQDDRQRRNGSSSRASA